MYHVPAGQRAAFAVTDDITQYTSTEFVDVYDKSTEKWYKLNNLGEFEEYGIYGDSFNTTVYVGKYVIVNEHEYVWNGTAWVDLGATEGHQITYTFPEYIERTSNSGGGVDLGEKFQENTVVKIKHSSTAVGDSIIVDDKTSDQNDWRVFGAYGSTLYYDFGSARISKSNMSGQFTPNIAEWEIGNYYVKDINTGNTLVSGNRQTGFTRPCNLWLYRNQNISSPANDYGKVWYVQIYQDDVLVKDFVPWVKDGVNGLFDFANMTFTPCFGTMTMSSTTASRTIGDIVYPEYYDDKEAPPVVVTFNTMADAVAYKYAYYGLYAMIAGALYVYTTSNTWELRSLDITGTTKATEQFTVKINGTNYTAHVTTPVGDLYNWGLQYDLSVPITNINVMNNADIVTIDLSKANLAQWENINGGYEIGDFYMCSSLKSVDISNAKNIGRTAFAGCESLELSTLPSSLQTIGAGGFQNCNKMTISSIPETVTYLDMVAFGGCESITVSTVPASFQSITNNVFENCKSITTFNTRNVTSIGNAVFKGCTSLASVSMPNVTSIGSEAFSGCTSLASVSMPNATSIGSNAFLLNAIFETIDLPETLTSIGNGAFARNYNLKYIRIPSKITTINKDTFYSCTSLKEVALPSATKTIGDTVFNVCPSLTTINLDNITSIGLGAFGGCYNFMPVFTQATPPTFSTQVFDGYNLPIFVNADAVDAYKTTTNLAAYSNRIKPIGWEPSVEEGYKAELWFNSGTNATNDFKKIADDETGTIIQSEVRGTGQSYWALSYAILGDNVISIGNNAFNGCSKLTSVSIPNVTSVGYNAFRDCSSFTSVSMPNVTSVGDNAFNSCTSLTSVSMPNVTSLGDNALRNCTSLASVSLPSIQTIGTWVFASNSKLETLDLGPDTTSIGYASFFQVPTLKTFTCRAITPPVATEYLALPNADVVYVPAESVDAYKSASGWSAYSTKIQPIPEP